MAIPGETRLQAVIHAWDAGALNKMTFVSMLVEQVTSQNVGEVMLRPDIVELLNTAAADAPTTDVAWAKVIVVQSYCETNSESDGERRTRHSSEIRQFRMGIEAIRTFNKNKGS